MTLTDHCARISELCDISNRIRDEIRQTLADSERVSAQLRAKHQQATSEVLRVLEEMSK